MTRGEQYRASEWLDEQAAKHALQAKKIALAGLGPKLAGPEAELARALTLAALHMRGCADNTDG